MSKNIDKKYFYQLPSGIAVHPCRLFFRDGTLMWKHALISNNVFTSLPLNQAHEAHIVKTAQRLEELNTWVSQDLDPWQCLQPLLWYDPEIDDFDEGIKVTFKHTSLDSDYVYKTLKDHIMQHECLTQSFNDLTFTRC